MGCFSSPPWSSDARGRRCHREREGFRTFDELAVKVPDRPLFLALAGLLQARISAQQPLLRRADWVEAAAAKLDRAAAAGGPLERYLRGVVFAELPERFGRAGQAIVDLEATFAHAERLPPGFRRGAWNGLAVESRLADTVRTLNERGDHAMALRIAELALAAHPGNARLAAERAGALDGLRQKYQLDPFKLIVYSEMAGKAIPPVPPARVGPAAPASRQAR